MMPKGSVIVITHNSAAHVASCLGRLRDQPDWERIIIDNGSEDNTVECVRLADPDARLVINAANRGFAAAVNQGVSIAQGQIILLLNPDTTPSPGALDKISEVLRANRVGAASGALLRPDGKPEIGFMVRRLPTVGGMLAEILLLNRLWPRNPWNRAYRCLDLDYSVLQEVEQPAAACLGFLRAAWKDIGGFDETFCPLWFEDVDFCRRLRNRGWKLLYRPDAVFSHAGGHSVKRLPFRERQVYWYRNLLRYFKKHHSARIIWVLRLAIGAGLLLRSFATLLGFREVGVREALEGYSQVLMKVCLGNQNHR
jgi:N-acetylglucosaminyl-diphospho-decaprenol L-rhamnosyltransferase